MIFSTYSIYKGDKNASAVISAGSKYLSKNNGKV